MSDGSGAQQIIDTLVGRAQSATANLHVRSALNPMLWLCSIVSPAAFFAAWLMRDVPDFSFWLTCLGALPIVTTCVMFIFFAIFRPQNLRSEEYQIRHEAIELIRQKGSKIQIAASSLEALANPDNRGGRK